MKSAKRTPMRKTLCITFAITLAASSFTSVVPGINTVRAESGFTAPQAVLDHLNQNDWSNLQQILSGINGSITSPLKISDVDKGSYTTGQLMGNGDIGVIAAGVSTTSQQFYFGKNDFWGTLHAQGSSVKDNQGILSGGGLDIWPTKAAGSSASAVFNMTQDILNAQVVTKMQLKNNEGYDATIEMRSWTADTDNVFVTEVENKGGGAVTLNTKQWVPKMAYANASATDLTDANSTYPYTGGIDSKGDNPVLWTTRDSNAGASGNTSNFRSRTATATTVVGAQLVNTREKIEANDYYDSNKGKYYDSLGESGDFTVEAGSTVYLVTYFASSSGAYDSIKSVSAIQADAVNSISAYTSTSAINQLKNEHLDWWKNYWLKSYAQFNDPDLNKYYYGSLYILGSSNRPTSGNGKVNKQNLPASMYGEWVPADNVGWGGRYFLNYNQQAHYYASGSVNRIETAIPYNRVIAYDLPWQINNAAAQGFDGAAHVRTLSPFHLMASSQPALNAKSSTKTYGFNASSTDQKSNGMFAAVPMIFYYEYTLDDNYLKTVLYPYLKQLLTFYSSYVLKQDDGNGQYHYSVIGSSIHEGDAADINPDLDIGAIKFLSNFLIQHGPSMKEDQANINRWQDLMDHTAFPEAMLPKGIFNADNNSNFVPTLIATDYQSPNQAHVDMIEPGDQPVELEGVVFPFENLQKLDGDKELLQKVLNTLEYMNGWAAAGFAGWSSQNNGFPKVYPIAARAGWPAADLLVKFKTALNAKVRNSNLTYYGSGGAVETIASMEALNSMVMQSSTTPNVPSTIRVFPNWDMARSVSYERLGAMGNVEVSSAYDAATQTIPYVDLNSKRNGKIALVNPWTTGKPVVQQVNSNLTLGAAVNYTIEGGKIIFEAQKGSRYMVMVDTSDTTSHVSDMSLDKYSATLIYNGTNGTDTGTVTATLYGNPSDTVTWTSSDPGIVAVVGSGNAATIKAVGTGANKVANVTVTARSAQDGGVAQTLKVKVADVTTVPASLVMVNPITATIYGPANTSSSTGKVTGNNRLQLTTSLSPSNAYDKRIMWTTSNPNVAMVDKNGLVIARGAGTVKITGTSMANPSLPPVTCTVTVTGAGTDYSGDSTLGAVLTAAKSISAYAGDKTASGGFKQVSASPNWEGRQEDFQKAHINALGVKAKYSGYSTTNISKDTALFAAIALNEAIRSIDPSKAVVIGQTVDKAALATAIGSASKLTAERFSKPEDWASLQAALQAAQNVNNNVNATQTEIDNVLALLQTAMNKAIPVSASGGSVPSVNVTAGSATIYGSRFVQLQASGSRTWSVSQPDDTATTDAFVDPSGVLYATSEGTYKVTAQAGAGIADFILVTFSNMSPITNMSANNNGNGSVFGSTSGGSYPPTNVFDGNPSSFFDHSVAVPYVGWDFGAPQAVNVLRFLPRAGTNAARIYQAKFQGSNESASSGYVDLVTITDNPSTANSSSWYVKVLNNTTAYRYYRWLGTNGSHGNVAEIQLFMNVDKTALGREVDAVESLEAENFTKVSWDALQAVLFNAISVNDNPYAGQDEIDAAAIALQAAMDGLQQVNDSALAVASGITSIPAPDQNAASLTLPSVPAGYTLAIKSSDRPDVIQTDGTLIPPSAETTVHLVLEVTRTSDGLKAVTASIAVVVPARTEHTARATLTGTTTVTAGASFDLNYGLVNVAAGSALAQDLTFTYDPEKLTFSGAESLKPGFTIVDKKETPGRVRILAVTIGAEAAADGELLKLRWNAKALTESSAATIAVAHAVIANGEGLEKQVEGVSHSVTITYVDKAALNVLIAEAQQAHDGAVEGTLSGQYPAGSKAVLQTAINSAGAVAHNTAATQLEVQQAAADLSTALQSFRASVITGTPGDFNNDGKVSIGDLAIVAKNYGKSSADPDWSVYQFADLNHDGVIDIVDLAIMARMIFNL
ncbi:glycosyl hydrolase family 95 catalytic domain-containing protein [Paenibacillus planticolens]|nr:cohesin domain-containing protein [Paenibacillus planticolens]